MRAVQASEYASTLVVSFLPSQAVSTQRLSSSPAAFRSTKDLAPIVCTRSSARASSLESSLDSWAPASLRFSSSSDSRCWSPGLGAGSTGGGGVVGGGGPKPPPPVGPEAGAG